jgi:hypothetical protein
MKWLLLWFVMRMYRMHRFRVSGHLNERVFASGDILMTGPAQRVLFTVMNHINEQCDAVLIIESVEGEMAGAGPARVLEAPVGRPIYRREVENE